MQFANVNEHVPQEPPLVRVTVSPGVRQFYRVANGKPGSLQTAAIMANLVREDAVKNKPLELWATQVLINNGLDSHSDPHLIADALYRYVQQFSYIHDPAGAFDSVQSAREVIREGKGDCDDLSVLLATLLALVGFKPRFVLAKYSAESEGFDHVYVDLELSRGRVALDPSTRKHGIGWESPKAIERVAYPIFDGKVVGLGDLTAKVKKLFAGFAGCGGDYRNVTEGVIGNVSATPIGGASFSFPTILLGVGVGVLALKAFDSIVERWS